MRISIVIGVTAVVIAATGAGYYGLEVYPQRQFRASLDQVLRTLPPGMTASYQDAHYAVASHVATVTGLKVHGEIAGNPATPFDIAIDTVETSNPSPDFAASWTAAAANPAALKPETTLRIADNVMVKGVTVHSAIVDMTEASSRLANPRVYPWAFLHNGIPSWNDVRMSLAQASQPKTLADVEPLLRFESAVALGFAYDSAELEDVSVKETLPAMQVAYKVHKMTAGPYDRGILGAADVDGVSGEGDMAGTFSLDHVTVAASDYRAPLGRVLNGEPLSLAMLDGIKMGRVEYRGLTVQPPGKPAIRLGALSVGPLTFTQGLPVAGAMGLTDLSVSRAEMPDEQSRDAFDKLGIDTMTISFALAYDWDVAGMHATVRDTMLKVNELGTLALSVDVTNLGAGLPGAMQARLAHAKLRFDDNSLVDRLLRMGATQSGTDPAAYRQQIVDMVRQQSSAGDAASPVLKQSGQAASEFIATPHSLTIELSPPTPFPFMGMQRAVASPPEFATSLGLKVTANQQ